MAREIDLNINAEVKGGATVLQLADNIKAAGAAAAGTNPEVAEMAGAFALGQAALEGATKAVSALITGLRDVATYASHATALFAESSLELSNLAAKTGYSASEVGSLQIALKDAGTDANSFARGVDQMYKRIEAGSPAAEKALRRIGLTSAELRETTPEDAFYKVTEALKGISDPMLRAATAMELLGRAGANLIPALVHPMDEVRDKAIELNAVLGDQQVEAGRKLAVEMNLLTAAHEGFSKQVGAAIGATPELTTAVDQMAAAWGAANEAVIKATPLIQAATSVAGAGAAEVAQTAGEVITLGTAFSGVGGPADQAWGSIIRFVSSLAGSSSTIGQMIESIHQLKAAYDLVAGSDWERYATKATTDQMRMFEKLNKPAESKGKGVFANTPGFDILDQDKESEKRGAQANKENAAAIKEEEAAQKALNMTLAAGLPPLEQQLNKIEADRQAHIAHVRDTQSDAKVIADLTGQWNAVAAAQSEAAVKNAEYKEAQQEAKINTQAMTEAARLQRDADKALAEANASETDTVEAKIAALEAERIATVNGIQQKYLDSKATGDAAAALKVATENDVAATNAKFRHKEAVVQLTAEQKQALKQAQLDREITEKEMEAELALSTARHMGVQTLADVRAGIDVATQKKKDWIDKQLQDVHITEEERQRLLALKDALDQVAEAQKRLAGIHAFEEALQKVASVADWASGVLQQFGVSADSALNKVVQGVSNIASSAEKGMQIGSMFGPTGAVVGGIIGGASALVSTIKGLFSKPEWKKAMEDVGKNWGVSISEGTAKAIESTESQDHVSRALAELLNINKIMADNPDADPRQFAGKIGDLMKAIQAGTVPAKEGVKALGDAFTSVAEAADAAGSVGDRALTSIITQARQVGGALYTKEMRDFVDKGLKQAQDGLALIIGQLKEAKDLKPGESPVAGGIAIEDTSKTAAKLGLTAQSLTTQAKDQASIFMAVFGATMSEKGLLEGYKALEPMFGALKAKLATLPPDVQKAASGILAPFARLNTLMKDEAFKGAAEAADGLASVMKGLGNSAYLDINTFGALQRQTSQTFQNMVAHGATAKEAIQFMAPTIQAAISAAQNFGVPLSADMQHLVDIGKQNGISFKTDPQQQMVDLLKELVHVMGGELPESCKTAAAAMVDAAGVGSGAATATTDAMGFTTAAVNAAGDAFKHLGDQVDDALSTTGQRTYENAQAMDAWAKAARDAAAAASSVPPAPGGGGGGGSAPHAAMGAIVSPRPGGSLYNVAEGGRAELIAPVDAFMNDLRRAIVRDLSQVVGSGGAGGGGIVQVNIQIPFSPLITFMERAQRVGALRVLPQSVKNFG